MELKIKALETAVETAKSFIQAVIIPPLEEVGGLLADYVKSWRLNNQINIIAKAEKKIKDKGIRTKKVSLKMMTPLLEEGSLEDDDKLQDMWASLLANTVAENSVIKTNIFTSTLKEMTTEDLLVFHAIFEHCTMKEANEIIFNRMAITPESFKEFPDADLVFDNLKRLRLIREIATHGSDKVPVVISELGLRFMKACS